MVKDRLFALNHPKSCAGHARPAMARGYGADVAPAVRWRTASGPLATRDHPLITSIPDCFGGVYT